MVKVAEVGLFDFVGDVRLDRWRWRLRRGRVVDRSIFSGVCLYNEFCVCRRI